MSLSARLRLLAPFVIVVASLGSVACSGHSAGAQSAAADSTALGATDIARFCETYEACRDGFRAKVGADGAIASASAPTGASTTPISWSAPLPEDAANEGLTIDFAFFPATSGAGTKLLLMSSGVHGLEGYTGSTLQQLFLDTMLEDTLNAGVSVLLVHGINAYGMKHGLRVDEHRVDLNRNWFPSETFPAPDDSLYDSYTSMLNPTDPAAYSDGDFAQFVALSILPYLPSALDGTLTRAAAQGQYRYPAGVEFGGSGFEPHHKIVLDNISPYLTQYKDVVVIDLHTGLGNTEMQLLPNPTSDSALAAKQKQIFEVDGHTIVGTGGSTFYSSYGDFSDFVCGEAMQRGSDCVNMLLEYGTLIKTEWNDLWAVERLPLEWNANAKTLYYSVRENQFVQHGASDPDEEATFVSDYRDQFFPPASDWRTMVLTQSSSSFPKMVANFATAP